MTRLEKGSRLTYRDVAQAEIQQIINSASILFRASTMKVFVAGTFSDRKGEVAFLEKGLHEVDLEAQSQLPSKRMKANVMVSVDGELIELVAPLCLDTLVIEQG